MGELVRVASVSEVESGKGVAFDVGEKRIAVFNKDGSFYALDDTCPHAGASLAEGDLEGDNGSARGTTRSSVWKPVWLVALPPPLECSATKWWSRGKT